MFTLLKGKFNMKKKLTTEKHVVGGKKEKRLPI